MPLEVQLEDVVEEFRVGSEPQAVIRFRRKNAGHVEDSIQDATDAKGAVDPQRLGEALWGRLIVGWSGIVDGKGQAVPFEAPADVVARVLARAKDRGEKAVESDLQRRAQGAWVYAVIRGFPPKVKGELQSRTNADDAEVTAALGN